MTESEGRERVLREAHALFLERGFAEVSMQQIADAAGMTKASLYYHFRNKEDLFVHVVRHEIERLLHGVTAELDGINTFQEQLKRLVMFAFRATRSDFSRLMSDFHRHVSDECQQQLRLEHPLGRIDPLQIVRPYFDRAKATGELRDLDTDVAIVLLLAMVGGLFKFSEHKTDIQLTDELAETMVDVYLHGVSPS
jgi:AcrR family transcriptional regulator